MRPAMRSELSALLRLASPILLTQLGNMLLGIEDTAIVGRMGEVELGAVGLGNNLVFSVMVLGLGWMLALDPLIAQALGAGERDKASFLLWQGRYLALYGAAPLMLGILALAAMLPWLGVLESTTAAARPYIFARIFGVAPFLMLMASRSFLQAHERTRPIVVAVIVANVLNVPLSWGLVFGVPALGVPSLGTLGAGVATAIVTVVQLAIVHVASERVSGAPRASLDRARVAGLLRLGTPIGMTLVAEVASFAIVGVLAANLGTRALGAHQVALTLISTTFQVAIAIGAAAAVRVGHAIGRADPIATRRAGMLAIGTVLVFMGAFAGVFLSIPRALARILTDEREVIAAAIPLLAVAAAFQLSDGTQAVAAGALRGAGDTRFPFLANLIGHYAIGVPLGVWLAFGVGMGATGLWWGLSAGLTAVALGLSARFYALSRRPIARVAS
ncbi:MAG: MATE family efflux transporter [Sandaracinaceae bacterium]